MRLGLGMVVAGACACCTPWMAAQERPASDASAGEGRPDNIVAEFPVFTDGDLLLVPVEVAGRTYSFMVDTGFSTTTFDTRLSAALAMPAGRASRRVRVIGAGTMETATARQFAIAGLPPFVARSVWRGDLTRIRESTGHEVMGIIGIDLLRDFVLHIDADAGLLQIWKQAPESAEPAITVRWRRSGTPTIRTTLGGSVADDLILDTGNFSLEPIVDLAQPLYQNLERRGAIKTLYAVATSRVDKFHEIRTGVLDELALQEGPTLNKIRASEHPEGLNLLGLSALMQFSPTFDFPHDRLVLGPRKPGHAASRFPVQGSGLALLRRDGATFVHSVRRNSRAAVAGVRTGDVVEFAAAKVASDYRLHELRLLLETTGPTVQLAVRADGGELRKILLPRQDTD
ncbi:MAG: retropepsin-like aspartic protease [Pirellulales bacterium]